MSFKTLLKFKKTILFFGVVMITGVGIFLYQYNNFSNVSDQGNKTKTHKVTKNKPKRIAPERYMDEAVATHISALQSDNENILYRVIHKVFYDSCMPPLVESLSKHPPLLDREAYRSMYVFAGTEANRTHNLCGNFASSMGIKSYFGCYLNMLNFAAVNGDKARIAHRQALIKALEKNPKINYGIRDVYQQANNSSLNVILFLARNIYPFPATQASKILYPEKIIPALYLEFEKIMCGFSPTKEKLKKKSFSVRLMRHIMLEFGILQMLLSIEDNTTRLTGNLALYWNLIKSFFPSTMLPGSLALYWGLIKNFFSSTTDDNNSTHDNNSNAPLWDYHIYKVVNFFWARVVALLKKDPWGVIVGRAKYTSEKKDFKCNLPIFGTLSVHNNIIMPLNNVVGCFFFIPLEVIKNTNNIFYLINQMYYSYIAWMRATNILHPILLDIYEVTKLMKKLNKLVANSKDAELKKVCKPHLARMQKFLCNRKFRKIIKKIRKLPTKPVTFWNILNPYNTRATDMLVTYKQLEGISKESEQLLRDAVASFYFLDPYASIAYTTYLSSKGLAKRKCTLAEVQADTREDGYPNKPIIMLDKAYTPMVKARNPTFNNVAMGTIEGGINENNLLMTGINGSGKSIFMRTIADNQYIFQNYGIVLANSGKATVLDKMVFCANVIDDASKGQSLMMAEADLLNRVVTHTSGKEKVLILIDELLKGTPQKEGQALLMGALMHLGKLPNTMVFTSTHLTGIPSLAKNMKYNGFTYYTTEYIADKGFTFKTIRGQIDKPAYIYILKKMNFNEEVFSKAIDILKKDPTYPFRDQLPGGVPNSMGWLLFVLLLMLGMGLGIRKRELIKKHFTKNLS